MIRTHAFIFTNRTVSGNHHIWAVYECRLCSKVVVMDAVFIQNLPKPMARCSESGGRASLMEWLLGRYNCLVPVPNKEWPDRQYKSKMVNTTPKRWCPKCGYCLVNTNSPTDDRYRELLYTCRVCNTQSLWLYRSAVGRTVMLPVMEKATRW